MALLDRVRYDEEQRQSMLWTRIGMGIVLAIFISGAYSCSELRYSIWGAKARAVATGTAPAPVAGRNAVTLRYEYTDANNAKHPGKHTFRGGQAERLAAAGTFEVIYMPGDPTDSKPVAARRWWAMILFLVMTGALVGWFAVFWYQNRHSFKRARR
jgi:hypothetical protein